MNVRRSGPTTFLAFLLAASKGAGQHNLALTADSRRDFQWSWSLAYRNADEDLARLCRGDVVPGPFYVFGDPTLLSGTWYVRR